MEHSEAGRMLALLRSVPSATSSMAVSEAVLERGSIDAAEAALVIPSLFDGADDVRGQAEHDVASWRSRGIGVHSFTDPTYPAALREVAEAPPLLFTSGEARPEEAAVAVVGTRRASGHALAWASELAGELGRRRVTVTSGGALGIDAAAHRAALAAGGRTVAVLGTGVDRCYPPEHEGLQAEIAASGLLISQFPPGAVPTKESFPQRNAVMSGCSCATVIVEAGERSGARIQARIAVEQGRRVLLARPVVESTVWGAALVQRAAVQVVDTVDEAVDKLGKILRSQADLLAPPCRSHRSTSARRNHPAKLPREGPILLFVHIWPPVPGVAGERGRSRGRTGTSRNVGPMRSRRGNFEMSLVRPLVRSNGASMSLTSTSLMSSTASLRGRTL